MMLVTVKGVYKDGKVELTETPAEVKEAEVLVTFLPISHDEERMFESEVFVPGEETRQATRERVFARMERGYRPGGSPWKAKR